MTEAVSLLAVGDLLLCGRYDDVARAGEAAGTFAPLARILGRADIAAGNMECVLSERGTPRPDKLCLRGSPAYAQALAGAGFDILSLANNHVFDYGVTGFEDTRNCLETAGVRTVGAGADAKDAAEPVILEKRGLRIGFLAYCHRATNPPALASPEQAGVAHLDPPAVIRAIARWRPEVDQLVLLLHWGLEYSPLPTPDQVELARRAVDAGAGAIIGHHSHMVQGVETYGSGVIAYSLGNCTDSDVDWKGPERHYRSRQTETDRSGLAIELQLSVEGTRIAALHPLWLNERGQPELASGRRFRTILDDVQARSQALRAGNLNRQWEGELVARRVLAPLQHWWSSGGLLDKLRGFRPSQLRTLMLLVSTYARIRLSRSEARWSLFSPRNDTKPMPYAGDDGSEDHR